jgi:hypothetical protein
MLPINMETSKLTGENLKVVWVQFSTLSQSFLLHDNVNVWHTSSPPYSWKLGKGFCPVSWSLSMIVVATLNYMFVKYFYVLPENPYLRGRSSTVDLLVLNNWDQLIFIANIVSFYKTTYLSEGVNRNEPSPLVRVPWFVHRFQVLTSCSSGWYLPSLHRCLWYKPFFFGTNCDTK